MRELNKILVGTAFAHQMILVASQIQADSEEI